MFLLNISHIQLNYAFLLLGSIFSEIHWKLLFLVKKVIISEWSSEVLKKCFFQKKLKSLKSRWKFRFSGNNYVVHTRKMGHILQNNVFLLNMSHIQLNYAFMLFWSIFEEIHWTIFFIIKKIISQYETQKNSEYLFFSTSLKN